MSAFAEAWLERIYLHKQRRNIVVLFEDVDMDWTWDDDELQLLAEMNNSGSSLEEMNKVFKRKDPDEIFLALFYLAKTERIKQINLKTLSEGNR